METNVFKPGAVMDLVANAQVKNDTQTIETAVQNQHVSNYRYLGKTRTIIREYEKINRNDKCPCGSGKKYKNCCLKEGTFEKHHELTVMEAADVKNHNINIDSLKKNAFVNSDIEEGE